MGTDTDGWDNEKLAKVINLPIFFIAVIFALF